jgi:hypothetical protein
MADVNKNLKEGDGVGSSKKEPMSRVVSKEDLKVGDIVGDFVVTEVVIRGEDKRLVWFGRK